MENNRKVELLAPAGNAEGFYGAVHAGADAVYLAGNRFGARAYAENFSTQELVDCIRYGHLMGRKIYLAVNTLFKDSELDELYEYLYPFCEAGLDAVIVQDLGALRFIRRHFPDCRLHASTQMTLCGRYGASLLKSMGVSRIVPSRELGLRELASLKQNVDVEVETFIHGAMCYCYSGQCLFSSILGGRSGNRGRCAQPCRLPYSIVTEGGVTDNCYPLSLKDMCTIQHIPRMIEAGIDSFKIEGRMKKPEYAAGVTAMYRRYIDKYYELRSGEGPEEAVRAYHVEQKDMEVLRSLYIRSEVQDGYYFRRGGREMVTLDNPAYSGSDEKQLREIREKYIDSRKKQPVAIQAVFRTGEPARVSMRWQSLGVDVKGQPAEKAQKQPVTLENVRTQLKKLGDSAFYASEINISLEEDCFYPLKQINELRRAAVAELEEKILAAEGYGNAPEIIPPAPDNKLDFHVSASASAGEARGASGEIADPSGISGYAIFVLAMGQLRAVADWLRENSSVRPVRIYLDGDLFLLEQEEVLSLCRRLLGQCAFYMALPYVIREADEEYLEKLLALADKSGFIRGFLVRSMDGLGFMHEKGGKAICRADAGLYIWNHSAMEEMIPFLEGFCLPYELNAREQRGISGILPCEKIVYGRIPMMITANCLLSTSGKCMGKQRRQQGTRKTADSIGGGNMCRATLKDRTHREFPVSVNCLHCMNIIYNSVPLSLYRMLPKWRGYADLRLDFTFESQAETKALLDAFLLDGPFPVQEYTTGHEKRGVE